MVLPQPGFCRWLSEEPSVEKRSCEYLLGLAIPLPSSHLRLTRHCLRREAIGDFPLWLLPPLVSLPTSECYCLTVTPTGFLESMIRIDTGSCSELCLLAMFLIMLSVFSSNTCPWSSLVMSRTFVLFFLPIMFFTLCVSV